MRRARHFMNVNGKDKNLIDPKKERKPFLLIQTLIKCQEIIWPFAAKCLPFQNATTMKKASLPFPVTLSGPFPDRAISTHCKYMVGYFND